MRIPRTFPVLWPHPSLWETLAYLAAWTWRRREQAKRSKLPFSEETITESVLLDLQAAEPRRIKVIPFNKREEGKNGADWEWCFVDTGKNYFFRSLVQAKLLD